jgi:hypothetical protein
MFNQAILQGTFNANARRVGSINPWAHKLFERSLSAGRKKSLFSKLDKSAGKLRHLESELGSGQLRNRHYAGTQTIAIENIKGSANKVDAFDANFHPKSEHIRDRWTKIATAMLDDVGLPPVELVQVGNDYFVVDGHHRISVALALGNTHIDAMVTVYSVTTE